MSRSRWREQFLSVFKATGERVDYVSANFITTWTSSSANRHAQVLRVRIVFLHQTFDTCEHSRSQRPAPTSVHCRQRTRHRITEQDRNAIRRLHTSQHARRVTDNHIAEDRVAAFVLSRLRFLLRLDHAHVRAVNLPATGQRPVAGKKLEKPATILQNVLGCVVVETGETQRAGRHRADATAASREAVDKTVLFEWRADEGAY